MKLSAALLCWMVLSSCAVSHLKRNGPPTANALVPADPKTTPKDTSPLRSDLQEAHLHLYTKGHSLGAYQIAVEFDASVAVLHEIRSCATAEFPENPEFMPERMSSGRITIAAHTNSTHKVPSKNDFYNLLTLVFRRVKPGTSRLTAQVMSLYDLDIKPIMDYRLEASHTALRFE